MLLQFYFEIILEIVWDLIFHLTLILPEMLAKSSNLCAFFQDRPKFRLHFVAANAQSQPLSQKIEISKRIHVDAFS